MDPSKSSLIDWDSYIAPSIIDAKAHKSVSAAPFAGQRDNIGKLCRRLRPRKVVCMGAGYLNDIPIETLVAEDADIYLVDWLPRVSEISFNADLITEVEGTFACILCQCANDPRKFCLNYEDWDRADDAPKPDQYCANFAAGTAPNPSCENYEKGRYPEYVKADVTRGLARRFADKTPEILQQSKQPRNAMRRAIRFVEGTDCDDALPLADGSADLITSSMLISQFDFEPYTFFVRNFIRRFGHDFSKLGGAISRDMEARLRDTLFLRQVEGHFQEMIRLLTPRGRIYFSIETMHRENPDQPWFQVEFIPKVMELIGKYFYFDFESLPETLTSERVNLTGAEESIIQNYILVGKPS